MFRSLCSRFDRLPTVLMLTNDNMPALFFTGGKTLCRAAGWCSDCGIYWDAHLCFPFVIYFVPIRCFTVVSHHCKIELNTTFF